MLMRCGIAWLLCSSAALAQSPYRDPVQELIEASYRARAAGRFDEATAKWDEARDALRRIPSESPQFWHDTMAISRLYANTGKSAEERVILEQALGRTVVLGDGLRIRADILNNLAGSWEGDGNLLRALQYRERALAEAEKNGAGQPYLYQQLANLYLRLGRRNDALALAERLRARRPADPSLASLYQQLGKTDEAAAIYRQQAQQAEPAQRVMPLQALASLYESNQQFGDAAAAVRQAIGAVENSGNPAGPRQTMWMRMRLAGLESAAGHPETAERMYEALLADPASAGDRSVLLNYTAFLTAHDQGAKAEEWLKDFLALHPDLPAVEQANLYINLADVARRSGAAARAAEYEAASSEKRRAVPSPPQPAGSISELLNRAQSAGCGPDTLPLGLQAIAAASAAPDRDQLAYRISGMAQVLVGCGKASQADQLYQDLMVAIERWSADSPRVQLDALRQYADYLRTRRRWADAQSAIERYRQVAVAAHGDASAEARSGLEFAIRLDLDQDLKARAVIEVQDLLASEAGLSGATSEPYQEALERAAGFLEQAGDGRGAVALWKQERSVADLLYTPDDGRRGIILGNIARGLARQGDFEEADRIAGEALATKARKQLSPWLAEELRRIKAQAGTRPERTGEAGPHWFQTSKFYRP